MNTKNASFTSTTESSQSHNLPPLQVGNMVLIHDPSTVLVHKRWTRTGRVVEVLPYHQYHIRMDGSGRLSLQNRKFLKINPNAKVEHPLQPSIPLPPPRFPSNTTSNLNPDAPPFVVEHPTESPARIPRALKQFQNFNKPGLKE